MQQHYTLSLNEAQDLLQAAIKQAESRQWAVVIAVVDVTGQLQVLGRMDGAQLCSIQIAQDKARTALFFKRPTLKLEQSVLAGRVHLLSLPGSVLVEGGHPIIWQGHVVGAIGVSGVRSTEDGEIVKQALTISGYELPE